MNSPKHIRHKWRARRGPPRGRPNLIMRTSPVAARIITPAMKKCITNGTPLSKPRGRLKAFTPPAMSTSASPTATVSAATLLQRVHADTVNRHQAAKHISVGGTLAEAQERGGGAQDEHGVDEQQPAAAMDGPPLLHY